MTNQKLYSRIVELWNTGRYKSYSALARMLHTYPKAVERAVKKANSKKQGATNEQIHIGEAHEKAPDNEQTTLNSVYPQE